MLTSQIGDRARQRHAGVDERLLEHRAAAAERAEDDRAERHEQQREGRVRRRRRWRAACRASAAARASSPEPSARLIAEDTPPPIAPADSICISMTIGKTRAMAASSRGAEDADVDGLGDRHRGDHQHGRQVGQRQPQRASAGLARLSSGLAVWAAWPARCDRLGHAVTSVRSCGKHSTASSRCCNLAYSWKVTCQYDSRLDQLKRHGYICAMTTGYGQALSSGAGARRDRREVVAADPARPHAQGPAALPGAGGRVCPAWRRTRCPPASRRWRRRA